MPAPLENRLRAYGRGLPARHAPRQRRELRGMQPTTLSVGTSVMRRYSVPVQQFSPPATSRPRDSQEENRGGGFWAQVPALPARYCQGETVDELKHNIREAIAGLLEVLKEEDGSRTRTDKSRMWRFEIGHRAGNVPAKARGRSLRRINRSHHIYSQAGERRVIPVCVHGSKNLKAALALRFARDAGVDI